MSDTPPSEIILEEPLPFDLVENILSRLPVKSLKRFRAVEKSWCRLIDSEKFAKNHLQRSLASNSNRNIISGWLGFRWLSVDSPDKVHSVELKFLYDFCVFDSISNSCNGLVVVKRDTEPPILFNPFSREYKVLPVCPQNSLDALITTYGFGYDSKKDDYKVVKAMYFDKSSESGSFEEWIYSLKSNSWRRTESTDGTKHDKANWPIHVKGSLHRLVQSGSGIGRKKINCFSVETEKDYELARPEGIDFKGLENVCLDVLDGYLALVCFYPSRVVVWVMEEYGVKESWVELLSIDVEKGGCIRPLAYIDGRDKILINHNCQELILLDLKNESLKHFKMTLGFPFTSVLCVETLISPHGWAKENSSAEKLNEERDEFLASGFNLAL